MSLVIMLFLRGLLAAPYYYYLCKVALAGFFPLLKFDLLILYN